MKIIKNILISFLILTVFFSCEDESDFEKIDTNYVAFETTSASFPESSISFTQDGEVTVANSSYVVRVFRSTADYNSDLTVNFTVASQFVSSTAFADAGDDASSTFTTTAADGSIVIPEGSVSASFNVISIDDAFSSGDKDITISITSTSDSRFELGFAKGAEFSTAGITIVDDDCPIAIADWVGTYTVDEAFTTINDPNGLGFFFTERYQVELSLDPSDATGTKVIANNTDGFNEYFPDGTVIQFITCPKEVEFNGGTVVSTGDFFSPDFSVTNSYDENSFKITASATNTGFGDYGFTLTKQ